MSINEVISFIQTHRCYRHQIFDHWSHADPSTETIGALFHQIRSFCDSTRRGVNLPAGLRSLDLIEVSELLVAILESEEGHGTQLAAMAGHIMNRSAGRAVCSDVFDQAAVEVELKECSDRLMGGIPGYDRNCGLIPQTRNAIAVFECRANTDVDAVYRNLGTTLALEIVSHHHLIPGEKRCLIDSGLYGVSLEDPEMRYLKEHWGECGAEALHEQNAISAIASILDDANQALICAGADDFLESVAGMWDALDAALLSDRSASTET